ncbi:ABC transporter permease subunit [Halobacillus salinarum]|uniref:ABC transporter permease subunit n=1 Tax=Halobacillus salinarum TaxID=2932257 RepID=A0ABY4EII0_9BACI|nr:ABC transporter permease subunit [Halobacillus salinarum]UOQ44235.1 ABC transporter permease subunit [Halobacillus salinarum]
MKAIRVLLYYFIGLFGIIGVSIIPKVMEEHGFISPVEFSQAYFHFLISLPHHETWVYHFGERSEAILPYLFPPYVYSMKIFTGAIAFGFVAALLLGIVTMLLPACFRRVLIRLSQLLETIPELLFAFGLQLFIVYIYKQTGVLLFHYANYEREIVLLPTFTLSILPMISFYRILLFYMKEEQRKEYVEFARSKGIRSFALILNHILRNLLPYLYQHGKIIIWSTLSSLLVVEYIFNIHGLTAFLLEDFRPIVIAVALTFLFTPFYILFYVFQEWEQKEEFKPISVGPVFMPSWSIRSAIAQLNGKSVIRTAMKWIKSMLRYLKNKKVLGGLLFLVGFSLYSFIYSALKNNELTQKRFLYGEDGKISDIPPHPPSSEFLLGSDQFGFSIADKIVFGAKYTILFAAGIAVLRVIVGFLLAIPYAYFLHGKWKRVIDHMVNVLYFLPLSILAYLLLKPVLWGFKGDWPLGYHERMLYEIILLALLAVPLVMTAIGNEMKLILQREYVTNSHVLGGRGVHVFRKHVLPEIASRFGILFGRQYIQVLLLFVHLGLFQLFFGGTFVNPPDPPMSVSFEWSGLLGDAKNLLITGPYWMIIPVLGAFMVIILTMQFIVEGIEEVQAVHYQKTRKENKKEANRTYSLRKSNDESFLFYNKSGTDGD